MEFLKDIPFWCIILAIIVAMIIHHLKNKDIVEGQEGNCDDAQDRTVCETLTGCEWNPLRGGSCIASDACSAPPCCMELDDNGNCLDEVDNCNPCIYNYWLPK